MFSRDYPAQSLQSPYENTHLADEETDPREMKWFAQADSAKENWSQDENQDCWLQTPLRYKFCLSSA